MSLPEPLDGADYTNARDRAMYAHRTGQPHGLYAARLIATVEALRRDAERLQRRIAELGDATTEHRWINPDGRETEFDLHNEGPCGCRRQSRTVYESPWRASGGHAAEPLHRPDGDGPPSFIQLPPGAADTSTPKTTIEIHYSPDTDEFMRQLREHIRTRPPGSGPQYA